jgi:hypothetical protein
MFAFYLKFVFNTKIQIIDKMLINIFEEMFLIFNYVIKNYLFNYLFILRKVFK